MRVWGLYNLKGGGTLGKRARASERGTFAVMRVGRTLRGLVLLAGLDRGLCLLGFRHAASSTEQATLQAHVAVTRGIRLVGL